MECFCGHDKSDHAEGESFCRKAPCECMAFDGEDWGDDDGG